MTFKYIPKFLLNIRVDQGLTQAEFADRLFISPKTISNWERGINLPPLDVLINISKTFQVPLARHFEQIDQKNFTVHDAERKKLINAFLLLASQNNINCYDINNVIAESGVSHDLALTFFRSSAEILQDIEQTINMAILSTLTESKANKLLAKISDDLLPVLYDHHSALKVLYSSDVISGHWLHSLQKTYIKWISDNLTNCQFNILKPSQSVTVELSTKFLLAIFETWLTQPFAEDPIIFRSTFGQLTNMSIVDCFNYVDSNN